MKLRTNMLAVFAGLLFSSATYASANSGIQVVAQQVQSQFNAIVLLVSSGAYVVGLALIVGGILKFKAYKDNPQQVQLSVPITMVSVGAILVYLNGIIQSLGGTFFGTSASSVGTTGSSSLY